MHKINQISVTSSLQPTYVVLHTKRQYSSVTIVRTSNPTGYNVKFEVLCSEVFFYKVPSRELFATCITKRYFQVKYKNSYSNCYQVTSGVRQGSVMGLLLCLIYTVDLPTTSNTTIATFVDDTALLAINNDPVVAS
jgi:hypothetical protein